MTAADYGGPGPDLYQLLGVPREASREEIAPAWRRRARDEHPGTRPAQRPSGPGRAGSWDEEDVRLVVLARPTLRYLARDRGRP